VDLYDDGDMKKEENLSPTGNKILFSDEDYLHLLQLKTRQAVARRWQSTTTQEGENGENESSSTTNKIIIPTKWSLIPPHIKLYDWQEKCLNIWMAKGSGTVKVATGGGKTLFALAVAQKLQNEKEPNLRVVIVVPTIPLMFQWYDEIRNGNLPESAIGLLGGGQQMHSLSRFRVIITVLNSAREKLPDLVKKAGWSKRMLLIVDECHRANAQQAQKIFDTNPAYTLGLSATPEPELQDENFTSDEAYAQSPVGRALGPIIYDFSIHQALKAGLLTPFEVWHIGLPLTPKEAQKHAKLSKEIRELRKTLEVGHRNSRSKQNFLAWCQMQASRKGKMHSEAERFIFLTTQRKRLLYQAESRLQAILNFLKEAMKDKDSRVIVFHESINEIEVLFQKTLEWGLPAVLEHSQLPSALRDENIEVFRRGIARIIISAKSLIEGFNVPSADLGIIAASSSSVRQRIQSLGRMLRKKETDRIARIIVLYIKDTEDEMIYEKADWEGIIGARQNRYFIWNPPQEGEKWDMGLQETGVAPRRYLPPSQEIDISNLKPGDPYPGRHEGIDLRVDASMNLRTLNGTFVEAPQEFIQMIIQYNHYRRAKCTPNGHLIVRDSNSSRDDWKFLGTIDIPNEKDLENIFQFKIKAVSGRRKIAKSKKGQLLFALGPDKSRSSESGHTRDILLRWIEKIEKERGTKLDKIFWDGKHTYWIETEGEQIYYPGSLEKLEFPNE